MSPSERRVIGSYLFYDKMTSNETGHVLGKLQSSDTDLEE